MVVLVACMRVAHAEPFTPPPEQQPTYLAYLALRNDAFSDATVPLDDTGFTHDNVISLRRQDGVYAVGGIVIDRWITSKVDRRRWDELDLFGTGERLWLQPLALAVPHQLLVTVRAGPSLGGNFGGRWMQNGWHTLCGCGNTLDQGLQNQYDGGQRIGFVVGARARAAVGEALQAYTYLDGQVAIGDTGVTSMQAVIGGSANAWHVGVHVELAATRYHVGDPNLALPGGYRAGWQLEWRLGLHARWSRYFIGYEFRANEGGSGEPIGVVEFQVSL